MLKNNGRFSEVLVLKRLKCAIRVAFASAIHADGEVICMIPGKLSFNDTFYCNIKKTDFQYFFYSSTVPIPLTIKIYLFKKAGGPKWDFSCSPPLFSGLHLQKKRGKYWGLCLFDRETTPSCCVLTLMDTPNGVRTTKPGLLDHAI